MFPYEVDYFLHLLDKEKRYRQQFQFRGRSPQVMNSVWHHILVLVVCLKLSSLHFS